MNKTPSVSVVVPFFNEADGLEAVCSELRDVLAKELSDFEVALIDDGSSDDTGAKLEAIARAWPEARVFHLRENKGQSAALLFGFSRTTAPIIVTMDGDGQNDPHDIPRLLARLVEADMGGGVRVDRQDGWVRRRVPRMADQRRPDLLGGGCHEAGGPRQMVSPPMPRASRLLATILRFGQDRSSVSASWAHASTRCSQLSSTSSNCLLCRYSLRLSNVELPALSLTPSAEATA